MATSWDVLEADEFASAIRVAAAVAADAWRDELAAAGLSDAQAETALAGVLERPLPAVDSEAVAAFGRLVQEALASVAEAGGTMAQRVQAANRADEHGAFLTSSGSGTAKTILAIAFLALIFKSDMTVDAQHFSYRLHSGIPAGLRDTLEGVAAVIYAARGKKPSPAHSRPTPPTQIAPRKDSGEPQPDG
jgi:hypothetical protein